MSGTFEKIIELVQRGEIVVSAHGRENLRERGLTVATLVRTLSRGEVVEDYPEYYAGPSVLVLQRGSDDVQIHALWGIEKGTSGPAVLITAYRPDPVRWSADFRRRAP